MPFKLLVNLLGSADESHGGQTVAPALEGFLGGGDNVGMVGQSQVVVGAEVEDVLAVEDAHVGLLRGGEDPFALEEAAIADLVQLAGQVVLDRSEHQDSSFQVRMTFPDLPEHITSNPCSKWV